LIAHLLVVNCTLQLLQLWCVTCAISILGACNFS